MNDQKSYEKAKEAVSALFGNKTELTDGKVYLELMARQIEIKAELYDGENRNHTPDQALRYATEELGEVASAITRQRWPLAAAECIDLGHTAFLIWRSVSRKATEPPAKPKDDISTISAALHEAMTIVGKIPVDEDLLPGLAEDIHRIYMEISETLKSVGDF